MRNLIIFSMIINILLRNSKIKYKILPKYSIKNNYKSMELTKTLTFLKINPMIFHVSAKGKIIPPIQNINNLKNIYKIFGMIFNSINQ
jgi:hypothetical protein